MSDETQEDKIAKAVAILALVTVLVGGISVMIKMDIQETDRQRAALPTATVVQPLAGSIVMFPNRDLNCAEVPCELGREVHAFDAVHSPTTEGSE